MSSFRLLLMICNGLVWCLYLGTVVCIFGGVVGCYAMINEHLICLTSKEKVRAYIIK